jgi:DNA repair protein SbcC/Rad50
MRPLALYLEGFGVFREPVEISFDDVDYFALVGPTGSGKSTVIDAICFALYGSVPRYGDERLVGRAVSLGKVEAKVSLTFAIGATRYRATRVVRVRENKATTPEALLEELSTDPEQPSRLLAGRAREMRSAVERLLGLPFAHFTKSVVLPQGEFARFLHDEPAERQKLLSRLLDFEVYKEIGQRARAQATADKATIAADERQLEKLSFASDESRVAWAGRRDALRELFAIVDAASADDERFAVAIAGATTEQERAIALTRTLAEIAVPDEVDAIAEAVRRAEQARADTDAALQQASDELERREAALSELPEAAPMSRALEAHAALEALTTEAEHLLTELQTADGNSAAANAAEAEANVALEAARAELERLRRAHAAHELATTLARGEPCPVCEQTVTALPKRKRGTTIPNAEKAVASAETSATRARQQATQAATKHAAIAARATDARERLDALADAIAEHPDRAAVEQTLATLQTAHAAYTDARKCEQAAREAQRAATRSAQAETKRAATAQRALSEARDVLLRSGLEPPPAAGDLALAWNTLDTWAREQGEVQTRAADEAGARSEAARAARASAVSALVEQARALDVATSATALAGLRDDVVEAAADASNRLRQIEDGLETAAKLRAEVAQARADCDVAELLASHMQANRFERWLLAEALDVLVVSASSVLLALSGAQYSLRYENEEFVVVDHRNADATRSIRTLSGGETFQASLALALALSDQLASLAAGGGTKLDAIFLDEGFGTLDADTLDTVAETIEALGTAGRMVGVVTHVPALAERVPVRYRVARRDRSATVTREDT